MLAGSTVKSLSWYDKGGKAMTELEKLDAGPGYCYDDDEVSARTIKDIENDTEGYYAEQNSETCKRI
jgi:hypothetical protein